MKPALNKVDKANDKVKAAQAELDTAKAALEEAYKVVYAKSQALDAAVAELREAALEL